MSQDVSNAAIIRKMDPEELYDYLNQLYTPYGQRFTPEQIQERDLCLKQYEQITGTKIFPSLSTFI